MNKTLVMTATISALAVNVMANGIVTGPAEPNTTAPVATGYNSIAGGANTTVTASNSVALGRDNNITADNTVVIGGGNGNVIGGQSTVIGYNNTVDASMEQTIIGANSQTSGQGAMALGTHTVVTAWDAVGVGNNIVADKANSLALGTNSVTDDAIGVDGITINGTRHVFAGEQPASVVSFGAKARAGAGGVTYYNRQLQNVSAGRVSSDSLDAINGSQLYAAIDEIETNAKQIAKNKQNIKDVAIGLNMLGDVVNDHEQAIAGNTTAIANNTARINGNTSAINSLGQKVTANTADIRSLEHVADNHEGRITTLENRSIGLANDINNKVNNLGQRVNRLGASSAALAGLHPLDFNRNDKVSYAVSYGHYRNSNAVALGVFARPNERIMLGFGATLGGENQYTVNVAFKTGKGSDYIAEAKDAQSRISKLEALVNKLMSEINK